MRVKDKKIGRRNTTIAAFSMTAAVTMALVLGSVLYTGGAAWAHPGPTGHSHLEVPCDDGRVGPCATSVTAVNTAPSFNPSVLVPLFALLLALGLYASSRTSVTLLSHGKSS